MFLVMGLFFFRNFNLQFSKYSEDNYFHTRWILNLYEWVKRNNQLISQDNPTEESGIVPREEGGSIPGLGVIICYWA